MKTEDLKQCVMYSICSGLLHELTKEELKTIYNILNSKLKP